LIIGPPIKVEADPNEDITELLEELVKTMSTGKAASEAAQLTGRSRKEIYQLILDMKS
jgi:16S rRNA C1402 (ribose-2'-O) methylase RsmI